MRSKLGWSAEDQDRGRTQRAKRKKNTHTNPTTMTSTAGNAPSTEPNLVKLSKGICPKCHAAQTPGGGNHDRSRDQEKKKKAQKIRIDRQNLASSERVVIEVLIEIAAQLAEANEREGFERKGEWGKTANC